MDNEAYSDSRQEALAEIESEDRETIANYLQDEEEEKQD